MEEVTPNIAAVAIAQVKGMAAESESEARPYWRARDKILAGLSADELEVLATIGAVLVYLGTGGNL